MGDSCDTKSFAEPINSECFIEESYRAELQSLRSVDDLVGSVEDALNTASKLDNT